MDGIRDVTSDKGIFNLSKKEITIPLEEYTDLIEKKSVLEQIRYTVSKDETDFGTVAILKAILQIDTQKKE